MLRVSFIIPVLNSVDTIERCLRAISAQLPEGGEIIVADNGSSDGTPELARSIANRVLVDKQATIAKLRNRGAQEARGDILVFVDSDCILAESWLERALEILKDEDVLMTGSKTHLLSPDAPWVQLAWKLHLDRTCEDDNADWIVSRALALKREAFSLAGGFDESLVTCEDVALGHMIKRRGRIVSSSALSPLHLKDAESLREMYKKEVWRGRDSILTSLRNLKTPKELLSLCLPLYYIFFLFAFLFFSSLSFFYSWAWKFVFLSSFLLILPITSISFDTALRSGSFSRFHQLIAVYSVYVLARVRAFFPCKKLKILYLYSSNGFGGLVRNLSLIVNNIDEQSFDVGVCSLCEPEDL